MSRTNGHLGFIEPQLPTLVDQPPFGDDWIHEIKHDGYRTLFVIDNGLTRAYTRNGFDWTDRYPAITKAAAKLDCRSAIIDGEVIVQDEHGVSDFEALKSAIRWQPQRLILCAFDLFHLNGKDLCSRRDGTRGRCWAKGPSLLDASQYLLHGSPHAECHDRLHGVGKTVTPDRLREHRRSRYLLVDALDGGAVRASGYEDDRCLEYLAKPPSDLDPFAASFEINVHQDNIGLIAHCEPRGLLSICR
jgi:ATP dependent DNA ligase domain